MGPRLGPGLRVAVTSSLWGRPVPPQGPAWAGKWRSPRLPPPACPVRHDEYQRQRPARTLSSPVLAPHRLLRSEAALVPGRPGLGDGPRRLPATSRRGLRLQPPAPRGKEGRGTAGRVLLPGDGLSAVHPLNSPVRPGLVEVPFKAGVWSRGLQACPVEARDPVWQVSWARPAPRQRLGSAVDGVQSSSVAVVQGPSVHENRQWGL